MARILFISTNDIWSGSEILWFQTAKVFFQKGFRIGIAVKYEHKDVQALEANCDFYVDLCQRFIKKEQPFLIRKFVRPSSTDLLLQSVLETPPDLVVVSQGSNIASVEIFQFLMQQNLNFITITQLVSEVHWLWLNNTSYKVLRNAYKTALNNYFVSYANLELHERMFGSDFTNNSVCFNPVNLPEKIPPFSQDYSIAFVGRIENFHKGLDLLIEAIDNAKWSARDACFNFYGDGPHFEILKETVERRKIPHVHFHGFGLSLDEIWSNNELLILPSRMEGQSLALLEAIAYGRSAICTDVGGSRELIEDGVTGFICEAVSAKAIEDSLEIAWTRRDEWEQMGKACRENFIIKMPKNAALDFFDKISSFMPNSETEVA